MSSKSHALLFFVIIAAALLTTSALAAPIIFTDRTAFDTAVGGTTLLTFDSPVSWTINGCCGGGTVDNLLKFDADYVDIFGVNTIPGSLCSCYTILTGVFVSTIDPVLAFGVDITPLVPNATININGLTFMLSRPQFLGFLYSDPSSFIMFPEHTFVNGFVERSTFAIDNVAIKSAPEPSPLLLLACGLAVLAGCRFRQLIL